MQMWISRHIRDLAIPVNGRLVFTEARIMQLQHYREPDARWLAYAALQSRGRHATAEQYEQIRWFIRDQERKRRLASAPTAEIVNLAEARARLRGAR
jgi:hypothetical protein